MLTYEESLEIELRLKEYRTFGDIARMLGKDRTTITKEIKRNTVEKNTVPGYPYNACIQRNNCKKKKYVELNVRETNLFLQTVQPLKYEL